MSPRKADTAPNLRSAPFGKAGTGDRVPLLSETQRRHLANLATRLQVPARTVVYREGTRATSVFVNGGGVAMAFRELPSGTRRVAAFLFSGDLFGLAENGRYVDTTRTVTAAMLYRLPIDPLTALLRRDPELEFHFLCKVTHELREGQRKAILLGRRDAAGRLATFIAMLEKHSLRGRVSPHRVAVPMSRTDIADYLALSPEAISRATRDLERRGIVSFSDRHTVRILDRQALDRLVAAV